MNIFVTALDSPHTGVSHRLFHGSAEKPLVPGKLLNSGHHTAQQSRPEPTRQFSHPVEPTDFLEVYWWSGFYGQWGVVWEFGREKQPKI